MKYTWYDSTRVLIQRGTQHKAETRCLKVWTVAVEWGVALHRRNPTAVTHRCAQRCDGDGTDSNVTALTVTALGHQWLWHRCGSDVHISVTAVTTDAECCVSGGSWHRCDSDVYISVTAMAADSVVTAVKTDSAVTAMCTLVWQRCQLPLLSQWCAHRCLTNVNIAVTIMWTSLSQRCQCHRCHSAVSCHRCRTSVHGSVTALSLSPLLHRCQFTSMAH